MSDKSTPTLNGQGTAPAHSLSYQFCLARADEAFARNDTDNGLVWLRQAEFIAGVLGQPERMPEVTERYGQMIARLCREAATLAVRCGNLTRTHRELSAQIETAAERLQARLQAGGVAEQSAAAAVITGFARNVREEVTHPAAAGLITDSARLARVVDGLDAMIDSLSPLGIKIEVPHGKPAELSALAQTAVENARLSISIFSFLSDWDRCVFWCEKARQALSRRQAAAGTADPRVGALDKTLAQAQAELKARKFRASARLLDQARQEIAALV